MSLMAPGARAERGSTRARRLLLGLLGLLRLLRLFRLLRFLSHSILSRFNGWKRDTRHARRRANLATSSNAIPTDSRRAASHCHVSVIALSTAVMRFGAFSESFRSSCPGERRQPLSSSVKTRASIKSSKQDGSPDIKSGDDTV